MLNLVACHRAVELVASVPGSSGPPGPFLDRPTTDHKFFSLDTFPAFI